MGDRVVLGAAVAAHFAFLAYAVAGGVLAWRWPRTIVAHVAGAAWLVLVVAADLVCPLTWLEDRARERLGMPATGGFLNHYIAGVFYPVGHEAVAQAAVATAVAVSWVGVVVRARRRRAAATPVSGATVPGR